MLYNDSISYNQTNVTFTGTLNINVNGILNSIILNNITVIFTGNTDLTNATTIGLVSYDISPTGVITISATQDQASAISGSGVIYLIPQSETSPVFGPSKLAESGSALMYTEPAAHIEIENLSS